MQEHLAPGHFAPADQGAEHTAQRLDGALRILGGGRLVLGAERSKRRMRRRSERGEQVRRAAGGRPVGGAQRRASEVRSGSALRGLRRRVERGERTEQHRGKQLAGHERLAERLGAVVALAKRPVRGAAVERVEQAQLGKEQGRAGGCLLYTSPSPRDRG